CDHRAPAPCECEPKGTDGLGGVFLHVHMGSPLISNIPPDQSSGNSPSIGARPPKSGPHGGICASFNGLSWPESPLGRWTSQVLSDTSARSRLRACAFRHPL